MHQRRLQGRQKEPQSHAGAYPGRPLSTPRLRRGQLSRGSRSPPPIGCLRPLGGAVAGGLFETGHPAQPGRGRLPSPLVVAEEGRALGAAGAEAMGALPACAAYPRSQLAGVGGARLTVALGIGWRASWVLLFSPIPREDTPFPGRVGQPLISYWPALAAAASWLAVERGGRGEGLGAAMTETSVPRPM